MDAKVFVRACLVCLAAGCLAACNTSSECSSDDDCPSPETCIKGGCVDDSCPEGCPAGQYCSNYYCYECTSDEHCGTSCLDCTVGVDQSCRYIDPDYEWGCGCWWDGDCPSGMCCNYYHCSTCP